MEQEFNEVTKPQPTIPYDYWWLKEATQDNEMSLHLKIKQVYHIETLNPDHLPHFMKMVISKSKLSISKDEQDQLLNAYRVIYYANDLRPGIFIKYSIRWTRVNTAKRFTVSSLMKKLKNLCYVEGKKGTIEK